MLSLRCIAFGVLPVSAAADGVTAATASYSWMRAACGERESARVRESGGEREHGERASAAGEAEMAKSAGGAALAASCPGLMRG